MLLSYYSYAPRNASPLFFDMTKLTKLTKLAKFNAIIRKIQNYLHISKKSSNFVADL